MQVRRLPVDPGPAAWNELLPAATAHSPVSGQVDADVVVVGAGFAGLSAAHRLRDLGVERIAVLEARRVAEGPAGRNSGFMIDLPHELNSSSYTAADGANADEIRLNRLGIDYAEALARRYQLPRAVFHRGGRVTGAATDAGMAHLNAYQEQLRQQGEASRTLDADQCQRLTGTTFYRQGLYTPGAAVIQPAAFVRALAEGLRGQLYEDSPVSDFSFRGGCWHLTTPGAVVRAPKVILAVNGHVQSFGFYPKQLLHVFTYASMTRALTDDECDALGGEPDWGMLPADPMGTTVRRISNYLGGGARLVIRNHATLNQSLETSNADMKRAARLQDRSFAARFPMLSGVPFEYRWGGRLCLALNSAPAFGELEPGLYSACCQNGLGTAKGMVSGMLAADMAMGDSSVASAYGARAPSRVPPEPFLSLGARVTMRVKEWRAGREL